MEYLHRFTSESLNPSTLPIFIANTTQIIFTFSHSICFFLWSQGSLFFKIVSSSTNLRRLDRQIGRIAFFPPVHFFHLSISEAYMSINKTVKWRSCSQSQLYVYVSVALFTLPANLASIQYVAKTWLELARWQECKCYPVFSCWYLSSWVEGDVKLYRSSRALQTLY